MTDLPTKPCPHCSGSGQATDHAELGRRLRADRERAGISRRGMAKCMGIKPQSLFEWEQGKWPWPARRLAQFIEALKEPTLTP